MTDGDDSDRLLAGRYRLGAVLGRGGMSTVYRAVDLTLERAVAVKVLSPLGSDASALARARSEIRVLASLNHRGLVTLHDAGTAVIAGATVTFLVTELVDGPSLAARLHARPLSPDEAAALLGDIAAALVVVHERGIVHRDVKPGNILLAPTSAPGRTFDAKLADFGIATLAAATTQLTAAGAILGTAAYLSPEQARGLPATSASDVYALGLVLLESLTGEPVFRGSLAETVVARLQSTPDVPGELGYEWKSLLTAMTAIDPSARPTAADLVSRALGVGAQDPTPTVAAPLTTGSDTTVALDLPPTAVLAGSVPLSAAAEPGPAAAASSETAPDRPARWRRRALIGVLAAACVGAVVTAGSLLGLGGFGGDPGADPAPSSQPTPHATATTSPPASVAGDTPTTAATEAAAPSTSTGTSTGTSTSTVVAPGSTTLTGGTSGPAKAPKAPKAPGAGTGPGSVKGPGGKNGTGPGSSNGKDHGKGP